MDTPKKKPAEPAKKILKQAILGNTGAEHNFEEQRRVSSITDSADVIPPIPSNNSSVATDNTSVFRKQSQGADVTVNLATLSSTKKPRKKIKVSSISKTAMRYFREFMENPLLVMVLCTFISVFACVGLLLWIHLGAQADLPGIWVYNLLHMFLSTIAGIVVYNTYEIINFIEDCSMSKKIAWRFPEYKVSGVLLSDIGERTQRIIHVHGTRRFLQFVSLGMMALSIWIMAFTLEWFPLASSIGQQACIPPTYIPGTYQSNVGVGTFISGGTTYAEIYMYGLPLVDGVFGGLSGWPLVGPSVAFSVQSNGPVYVIKTACDAAVEVAPYDISRSTRYTNLTTVLLSSTNNTLKFLTTTLYPQGSVKEMDGTVQQNCTTNIIFGSGSITISYVQDEWNMVTGGQMLNIGTGNLAVTQGESATYSYSDIVSNLQPLREDYSPIVAWAGETIVSVMNQNYLPSQGGLFCNLMQWSTEPDGFYHNSRNYKGVAAAISSIVQFVTMQYDGSQSGLCEFYSDVGQGRLGYPDASYYFFIASMCFTICLNIVSFALWLNSYLRDEFCIPVVSILRNPLLLARDMKHVMMEQRKSYGSNNAERDFHRWARKKTVVYGEIIKSPIKQNGFGIHAEINPSDPKVTATSRAMESTTTTNATQRSTMGESVASAESQ